MSGCLGVVEEEKGWDGKEGQDYHLYDLVLHDLLDYGRYFGGRLACFAGDEHHLCGCGLAACCAADRAACYANSPQCRSIQT